MIDERHEELASLYALDLLEGTERTQFEAALARSPELQDLVRALRESSARLAHAAPPATPPAALKTRVLASIDTPPSHDAGNASRPAGFGGRMLIPWAIAAGFALSAAWLGQRSFTLQSTADAQRVRQELAEIALASAKQQLEAERILARRRLQDADQQLADARAQLTERERLLAEARTQLSDRDRRLADHQTHVTERERQIAALTSRIESLAAEMKSQGDLATLKIAALSSLLRDVPEARAIAVWDPRKQEGVFAFDKVPVVGADQKLELWVVEARDGAKPISAGVMNVATDGSARVRFKPTVAVGELAAFAVSRETNDGARSHPQPGEVIMLGHSR